MEKAQDPSVVQHFVGTSNDEYLETYTPDTSNDLLFDDIKYHFTRDSSVPKTSSTELNGELEILKDIPTYYNPDSTTTPDILRENMGKVFSGSTTSVNPENDPEKNAIMKYGLENSEVKRINGHRFTDGGIINIDDVPPPLSPIHPFTRLDIPSMARALNLHAYNRFQYPIADLEHRKAFRNVFITRPECYVEEKSIEHGLCRQTLYDEDFSSAYGRTPYLIDLLAPVYVSGSFGTRKYDNINYLLSNRVKGLSVSETRLGIQDTVTKGVEGYTVTPGMHLESNQGGTISITFRETKYLEVYEFLRLWMLYIYKRKRGMFFPPYDKYSFENNFPETVVEGKKMSDPDDYGYWYHALNRAIEYGATIFDFVTNESNDRIIYFCKYYGIYPISVSVPGLSSSDSNVLSNELVVEATFQYQAKSEGRNKTLIEFNYNAGVCDHIGRAREDGITDSDIEGVYSQAFTAQENISLGAGEMFTGSPFVVMGVQTDYSNTRANANKIAQPYLRFSPHTNKDVMNHGNLGIKSHGNENAIDAMARS